MKCNQLYKYLRAEVSETAFSEHLKSCENCALHIAQIQEAMTALDEKVELPLGLADKVVQRRIKQDIVPVGYTVDYNKYLQIAAVVAVGIFLGIFLGSRANSNLFLTKKEKKDRALLEYREYHHLTDQTSIYRF